MAIGVRLYEVGKRTYNLLFDNLVHLVVSPHPFLDFDTNTGSRRSLIHSVVLYLNRFDLLSEIRGMSNEVQLISIMGRLEELGLLSAIYPVLTWDRKLKENFTQVDSFSPRALLCELSALCR